MSRDGTPAGQSIGKHVSWLGEVAPGAWLAGEALLWQEPWTSGSATTCPSCSSWSSYPPLNRLFYAPSKDVLRTPVCTKLVQSPLGSLQEHDRRARPGGRGAAVANLVVNTKAHTRYRRSRGGGNATTTFLRGGAQLQTQKLASSNLA